jgi:nidogen-like/dockerin type I repeat protein
MYKTYRISGLAGLGAVLFAFLLAPTVVAVPLSTFIPFGQAVGDTRLPANDDGSSSPINLLVHFPFFGVPQPTLFVNNNGNITFQSALSDFTPFAFPSGNQIIAPYFADVDTTGSPDVPGDGLDDVYFSERANQTDLGVISAIINQAFGGGFAATSAFVATWDHVGYFSSHVDKLNTFQVVLTTDGEQSFVIFHYLDNGMQWEAGDADGGMGGFVPIGGTGTSATAGFDAGDNVNFSTIPGSLMPGISALLHNGSNVSVPGQWVFQVNMNVVSSPPVLLGDINNDNVINALDARLVLEALVGLPPALHFASAGDVNADGIIDNRDSILILAIAAGRIPSPPDPSRMQALDNGSGGVVITGSAGAVPASSTVNLLNTTNGATTSVLAASDGSFVGTALTGVAGDTIVVDVNGSPARAAIVVIAGIPG